MLALVPLSSADDVPQNLVFLSNRNEYYYIVVAASVLTLSPALVLWTGLCAVVGLAGATAWITAGMERVVGHGNLPPSPSREDYFAFMLNPDFLSIPVRINEGVVIVLVTCIAALAVHRARNMVRAHAAAEAEPGPRPADFRPLCPGAGGRAARRRGTPRASAARREHPLRRHRGLHAAVPILAAGSGDRDAQQLFQRGDGGHRRARRGRREPCRRCLDRIVQCAASDRRASGSGRWAPPAPSCRWFRSASSRATGFDCASASQPGRSRPARSAARSARPTRFMGTR